MEYLITVQNHLLLRPTLERKMDITTWLQTLQQTLVPVITTVRTRKSSILVPVEAEGMSLLTGSFSD